MRKRFNRGRRRTRRGASRKAHRGAKRLRKYGVSRGGIRL